MAMKTDLSTTFLSSPDDTRIRETASRDSNRRFQRRVILVIVGLVVAIYLTLIWSALSEAFRPTVSLLSDGWFRIKNRELCFQIDVPTTPIRRPSSSAVEYQLHSPLYYSINIQSYSMARQLLNISPNAALKGIMQADSANGTVTILGSGVIDSKTQWIEYAVQMGTRLDGYVMRRKLILHNTQLLDVSITGPASEVRAEDADRIMSSAIWY